VNAHQLGRRVSGGVCQAALITGADY
jgi:hypothetical protein